MVGLGIGLGFGVSRGDAPIDADAVTLFAAMSTPASGDRQELIDSTIKRLKAAGIWSKMDLIYTLAAHDAQARRLNWKAPGSFALTDVSTGPTFVTDRGDTGNGSSTALDTGFTPATHGANYTQDSASLWVWCLTNVAENAADIGAAVTHNAFIRTRSAGDAISGTVNSGSTSTAVMANSIGFTGMSRPNASTERIFKNGAQVGSDLSVTSTGRPAGAIRICGRATDLWSTKQIAFAAVGGDLTVTEAASFYAIILDYLEGVGAA
jgi:hypothetical protein